MPQQPPDEGTVSSQGNDAAPGTRQNSRTPGRQASTGRRSAARGGRATARNVEVALRRADVLSLRRAGISYTKIAEAIQKKYDLPRYGRADAAGDVRVALDQVIDEPARDVLEIELSRLDALQVGLWAAATDPASDKQIPAVIATLRVMERRARYLGLDSPIKHDLTGGDRDQVTINLSDPAAVAMAGLALLNELATAQDQRVFAMADRELPPAEPAPPPPPG